MASFSHLLEPVSTCLNTTALNPLSFPVFRHMQIWLSDHRRLCPADAQAEQSRLTDADLQLGEMGDWDFDLEGTDVLQLKKPEFGCRCEVVRSV